MRRWLPVVRALPYLRSFCSLNQAKVDMKHVKALRELTGAPMSDCKTAIVNSQNESDILAAAANWLRKHGKIQQAKKAGRATNQGLIGLFTSGKKGILVELNCETDFVAQNQVFHSLLRDITLVAGHGTLCPNQILSEKSQLGKGTIADHVSDAVNVLRENIQVSRIAALEGTHALGSYVHQGVFTEGPVRLGKIGCLVAGRSELAEAPTGLEEVLRTVAMHVAAASPRFLSPETVPPDVLEAETKLLREQVALTGNTAHIDKVVAGRLKKFYDDSCLLNQKLLVTERQELVSTMAKENDCVITGFLRFQLGEALV